MNHARRIIVYTWYSLMLVFVPLLGQMNIYFHSIQPLTAIEQHPLTISIGLNQSSALSNVTLFYRQFGQSEYRVLEMQLMRDSAVAEIPATEVMPPFIELYIQATTLDGITETFPFENPDINPARIIVNVQQLPSEIIILSPEEGEQIIEGETYISISFVYADESIDRAKTTIKLNGVDLSEKAVLFDDLLIVPPDAVPYDLISGGVNLEVQTFDTTGNLFSTLRRSFNIITPKQAEEIKPKFQGWGNAQAESRHESIKGNSKWYNKVDARGYGTYQDFLKAHANISLTSEEKSENQPQNRYFLGLDTRYAKLGLGDAYPRFPFTIMDGRRIRGITGEVLFSSFNLTVANGQTIRKIQTNDTISTYERTMLVIRPSFGKGENFQWGFTYMKAKDDFDPALASRVKPQENVAIGSDLMLAFDNRRIEFTVQSALSLNNVDISRPEFTEASIDTAVLVNSTLSQSEGDDLKRILPIAKQFITVNENLVPIAPQGLTSLVYEAGLALNYFGNYVKGTFIYHGKDYTSAGATAIRKDIRGFNIIDRYRTLENRLFLTVSYEMLENNTSGFEIATTTYTTINTSASYFPARAYPNITIGYGRNTNSNPINPLDTIAQIAARALDDKTNRYFMQSSYDFSYWGKHNVSLNIDISNKDDQTPKQQDVSTFNMAVMGSTVHNDKLESTVGLSFSSLEFPQSATDTAGNIFISQRSLGYQTLSLTARYKIEEGLRLTGAIAPTFGDLARLLFETSLQYSIAERQTAVLHFQFIRNSSSTSSTLASRNDSYISVLYRIEF